MNGVAKVACVINIPPESPGDALPCHVPQELNVAPSSKPLNPRGMTIFFAKAVTLRCPDARVCPTPAKRGIRIDTGWPNSTGGSNTDAVNVCAKSGDSFAVLLLFFFEDFQPPKKWCKI
jgi:hypothetical protein